MWGHLSGKVDRRTRDVWIAGLCASAVQCDKAVSAPGRFSNPQPS